VAIKQYKAVTTNNPMQVKGRNNMDDKKLPQKDTILINRSLFDLPHPGTKQGHSKIVTNVKARAGPPKTMICKADMIFANILDP